MSSVSTQSANLVEVYPVIVNNLPPFTAWRLNAPETELASLGQKLAHRLRLRQGNHWIWAQGHLVTDAAISKEQFMDFLKTLWDKDDEAFKQIRFVELEAGFQCSVQTQADFVAFGVATDLDKKIRETVKKHDTTIRNAKVERDYEIQGWDVDGNPAISITVFSHLISAITLNKYISTLVHDINDLLGIMVRDKTSTLRGEIIEIVGTVSDHRDTLMKRASREIMQKVIAEAADTDLIVNVKTSTSKYDYPTNALNIVVTTGQYDRLKINGKEALAALQIQPQTRYEMVTEIAKLFAALKYIEPTPYSTSNYPDAFGIDLDNRLDIKARLGDGATCECNPVKVLNFLRQHPVYRRSSNIPDGTPIKIAVLNLIGDNKAIPNYLDQIRKNLRDIKFDVKFTGAERLSSKSHRDIEGAIERLAKQEPHIILTLVPGDIIDEENDSDLYLQIKAMMIGIEVESQVIYEKTLTKADAINNIILGVLGKTGNVIYVLDKPLPYADLLVGIDISRERNKRKRGSISMAAMTRVYAANGDFLKYSIVDAPIEGETLTMPIIRKLFPARDFSDKTCVIHRDGLFRGKEKENLKAWAQEIGATFHCVEVIKSRVPRLYKREYENIIRPTKGTAFILNSQQAFMVSSLSPSRNSTPRPLFIRIDEDNDFSIWNALHSILALTHLHIGSLLMPRLPITLHYSDQIGYLILRGVRPQNSEGTLPFWL